VTFRDNGDGTATLAGTPAERSGGVYPLTLGAANGVSPAAVGHLTLTVSAPPLITIASPAQGARYARGSHVPAAYSCQEGAGSPGLSGCAGPVADGARIDTRRAGRHTFTVTAVSRGGLRLTRTVTYRVVLPDNGFAIGHVRTRPSGRVRFSLAVPGPGIVDVLETSARPGGARATRLLRPRPWRFAFARRHLTTSSATTRTVTVHPNRRGRRALARHPRGLLIRLWVSYTPNHGEQRDIGLCALRIPGRGPHAVAAAHWIVCGAAKRRSP
jgi:hypothetical protein